MAEHVKWAVNIVGHGEVDPRTLVGHPLNPKIHTGEQDAVVEASLRRFGWLKPVIQNRTTGHVLDGHERMELAIRRGEKTVPVDYVEVAEADEGAVLRTLDPSGQLAKTHLKRWAALHRQQPEDPEPVLRAFLTHLAKQYAVVEEKEAPKTTWGGWAAARPVQEEERARAAAAQREAWGVEEGQTWQLGRHRVVCGDSLEEGVAEALMEGSRVDLVVTSPPYGIDKAYEQGQCVEAHRELVHSLASRCRALVRPGGFVVVNFGEVWSQRRARAWTGSEEACIYPMSLEYWEAFHVRQGFDLYAQRVWVKPFGKLRQPLWTYHTSLAHQQEWEHLWTWRRPGGVGEAVYEWDVSVHAVWDSSDEWLDRDGSGPWAHWSAGYPSYIPRQSMRAHSAPGALVWEPFLGAGTTLLACEELGRTCYGIDRDPGAIAVTLARFNESTGQRPARVA